MGSPQIVVVVNPQAQNGALGRRWADLAALIRREVGSFEEMRTTGPGEAISLTRQAVRSGADVVAAIGGDGTINEVANGFFDAGEAIAGNTALAIIPFGTGGDFRKSINIPKDVARAAQIITQGKRRVIDVGRLEFLGPDGESVTRMFVNIASFGASGLVVKYANESSKRLGGRLTFMLATARANWNYDNQRVHLVFDDDERVDMTINTIAVANGRYFGGGMMIAPDAELDDGQFDVVALGDMGLSDFIFSSRRLYNGTHIDLEKVSHRRTHTLRAEAQNGEVVRLDVDGENPGTLPATFRIVPKALPVIVP